LQAHCWPLGAPLACEAFPSGSRPSFPLSEHPHHDDGLAYDMRVLLLFCDDYYYCHHQAYGTGLINSVRLLKTTTNHNNNNNNKYQKNNQR
jgi:hypothetical protein